MRSARLVQWLLGAVGLALALLLAAALAAPLGAAPPAGTAPTPQVFLPLVVGRGLVDLSVKRVEVIQGISMSSAYTVQVAHRPALVRAVVAVTGTDQIAGVTGRLTRYVGGVAQDSLDAGPITAPLTPSEGSLSQTLNFTLPANWLATGTAYVLQLDPDNAIPETNETNNRYPPAGQQSFNFQNAPALNVVLVPVHYARPGAATTSDPPTGDLSYLEWMPIKVYPLAQINYSLHSGSLTFTGDLRTVQGWEDLLNAVTTLHDSEDSSQSKEYVAVVDSVAVDGCGGGCIAGIGWVNQPVYVQKTAVSFAGFAGSGRNSASPVVTHEMGHTFGRGHSPCGTTVGLQPGYPYANGVIGQWGYDNATGQLYSPTGNYDYMSYCSPVWTSDYTYQAIFNAWSWLNQPFGALQPADFTPAWVLSGSFDAADRWQVGVPHIESVPKAELAGSGPLRLELLDGAGHSLISQAFGSNLMALDTLRSGFYAQGFRVVVPVTPGAVGFRILRGDQQLYQRAVSGPAPALSAALTTDPAGTQLGWGLTAGQPDVTYTVRLSPDGGSTWQVIGLDLAQPSIALPAPTRGALVEVQATDGVRAVALSPH